MKVIIRSFADWFVRCTDEDGGWDEVYDPRVATVFPNKKAANKWIKNEPQMGMYLSIVDDIDGEIKAFEKWVEGGMVRRQFNGPSNYNTEYDPEKHTALDVLDWNYQHAVHGDALRVSSEAYDSWTNELWNQFNFIHEFQGYYSSDYKNKYVSFEINVGPRTKFEDFKKEIDMVLDNFEFNHLDGDGNLIIELFENDLHETRAMVLLMQDREKDQWGLEDLRYSFGEKELEKVSLERAFDEIRRNYYYD